jgi:hypothetical protein
MKFGGRDAGAAPGAKTGLKSNAASPRPGTHFRREFMRRNDATAKLSSSPPAFHVPCSRTMRLRAIAQNEQLRAEAGRTLI